MTIIPLFIFSRKSFCRYGCFVGRVSGLYALFSPVEIRSKNKKICQACPTKDCYYGNEEGNPCPTFQCLAAMNSNTYCTLCTECIKSCKKDNVSLNIRPFAKDLTRIEKTRKDEAYLAIIMLSLTSFHGLTMTSIWTDIIDFIQNITGNTYLMNFTAGMILIILLPILVYYLFCKFTKVLSGNKEIKTSKIFVNFAYSFLPIALFYHLAHNVSHLLMEGLRIIPLLSDPFGLGWNLFGTADMVLEPIFSMPTIWYMQIALILIGHIVGIIICSKIAKRTFINPSQATKAQIPILMAMIVYSIFSLHLIAQPMIMRTFM